MVAAPFSSSRGRRDPGGGRTAGRSARGSGVRAAPAPQPPTEQSLKMHATRVVVLIVALTITPVLAACGGQGAGGADRPLGAGGPHGARTPGSRAGSDERKVRDVIRRWNTASLRGGAAACALVDPATLHYLEQIDLPCESVQSGTLTAESERDVRSTRVTAIEIDGDRAVAHTRSLHGGRDIELHRVGGTWLIRQF